MGDEFTEAISKAVGKKIDPKTDMKLREVILDVSSRISEDERFYDEHEDLMPFAYGLVNVSEKQKEYAEMLVKANMLYHGDHLASHLFGVTDEGKVRIFDIVLPRSRRLRTPYSS
jgi:hypothetical protein